MSLDLELAHILLAKELEPSFGTWPLTTCWLCLLNVGLWHELVFTRNLTFTRCWYCEKAWLWWVGTCHRLWAQAWTQDLVLGHEARALLFYEIMFRLKWSNSFIPLVFPLLKLGTFFEALSTFSYTMLILGLFWVVYVEIMKVLSYSIMHHYYLSLP